MAAGASANSALDSATKAEGYALGTNSGQAVGSDSPYYHNNSKYYSEQSASSASDAADSATAAAASAADSNSRLYWVTLGTTTVAQITTALSNNLLPVAKYNFTSGGSTYTGTAIYSNTITQTISSTTYTVHYFYDYHWDKAIQIYVSNITGDTLHQTATQIHVKKVNVTQDKTVVYGADRSGDKTIEFDSEPTADSAKLLTSGAVHAAIDAAQDDIEEVIADLEVSTTATKNYAVGDLVIVNDTLYEVTVAIASGETITSGTNCSATTIEAQLKAFDEAKADADGYYDSMTVGNAEQLVATVGVEDNAPYNFRTTGGNADVGDRKTMEIVGGTIAWNQLVTTDTNVSKTKSGDIVTVEDAVAGNAQGLVVNFEPQQDLHGYDNPWPAGGGVNKINAPDVTLVGGNYLYNGAFVIPAGTYTINFSYSSGASNSATVAMLDANGNALTSGSHNMPWTFTTTAESASLKIYVSNAGTYSNIQINEGSAALPYAPYSNVCPITGWTGCEATRTGKNLLNPDAKRWVQDSNMYFYLQTGLLLPVGAYTLSYKGENNISALYANDIDGSSIALIYNNKKLTFTLSAPTKVSFNFYDVNHNLADNMSLYQLEFGSAATDYEPYSGTTVPVSWQTEAGTVYGGTYEFVSGEGESNLKLVTLNGSETWGSYSATYGGFYLSISDADINGIPSEQLKSNLFKGANSRGGIAGNNWVIKTYNSTADNKAVFFCCPITDKDEWLAWLANNPVQLLYPLETPVEIQLTPQQIALLAGTNNVWNDIGSTELTYLGTTNEIVAQTGHKYLAKVNGVSTVVNGAGQTLSGEKARDNIFDLTQMFGSAIADYVYSLENTTAGNGVAWFRHLFPKPYYAYNAGELMSVNTSAYITTAFNQWDCGKLAYTSEHGVSVSGQTITLQNYAYQEDYNRYNVVKAASRWYFSGDFTLTDASSPTSVKMQVRFYYTDGTTSQLSTGNFTAINSKKHLTFKTTEGKELDHISFGGWSYSGTIEVTNICLSISWDGERDGEYEHYEEHVYPLDESLTLRGIPKLDSGNNFYYDGDIYESDGTVTRKYAIVDLGTLSWGLNSSFNFFYADISGILSETFNSACNRYVNSKASTISNVGDKEYYVFNSQLRVKDSSYDTDTAFVNSLSNVYFVYELATPTTEEADPYQSPQIIDDFGTEEFVDYGVDQQTRDVAVPVGHNSVYAANLRAKLEMAPDSPDGDGDYIVRQTNGTNEYVPLVIPQELPDLPSSNGTYRLQVVVSGNTKTLSWVSA